MRAFIFKKFGIPEIILIKPKKFSDSRGFFMELYDQKFFRESRIPPFVQDNFSHSCKNVLRGLHYQKKPYSQGKLIMVLQGKIFDTAVDIRKGSPTFGKWVGRILSDKNNEMIYVPSGFAHGFCVLSNQAKVLYKVTKIYNPKSEGGILWNDPEIGISWPIKKPILSSKDSQWVSLSKADINFIYK